jgi:anaerobic magnesium-protoporphyrin IX monomethyl ester cyclase
MTAAIRPQQILFLTPPYHYGLADVLGRWIPLNLVYLAAAAREAGLGAAIYDAQGKNHGYPEIRERLRRDLPDFVACSAMTATLGEALKTLELAKELNPATVTILGGVHPSFMYREVLESPAVDFVVVGEGEATLRELLQVLQAGGDPGSVPGVACRRGGIALCTPGRPLIQDLDGLPAAWDLLDWEDYRYQVLPGSRMASVSTSRGCEHDCSFCSQGAFWGNCWRGRDPGRVAQEIAQLHEKYGVSVIQIVDEHPTRDAARWEALLDLLIARKLPVSFLMETRAADLIRDRDLIGKYRQAGVIHVAIGGESQDQERLHYLKKGMAPEEAGEALRLLRDNGIVSEISFLLGFPDDTPQSVADTLKYARALNPDNANFLAITPWPYSGLYRELEEFIRVRDYARYNMIDPVLEPRGMTLLQTELCLVDCFRKFYMGKIMDVMTMKDEFRRSYMVRATKLIMASPFVMSKFGMLVRGMLPAGMRDLKRKFNT